MFSLISDQRFIYRFFRHALLILGMVGLFTWVSWSNKEPGQSTGALLLMVSGNAVVFFAYAYITVYMLVPAILLRKRYFLFALSFLVTGIVLSMGKFLISDYIFYQAIAPEDNSPAQFLTLSSILVNIKDMTFIVALFAIMKFTRDHFYLKRNVQEMNEKRREAEMKLLRHQMDPHVIFNNFNSLYSISIYRPQLLQSTVKMLKSNLHYMFQGSKLEKVPLAEELKMIQNYIGLEKLRYGERLRVEYDVTGAPDKLEIFPLILYPFVENCFVHGAGEDPSPSWIRIHLEIKDDNLTFFAANSVSGYNGANLNSHKSNQKKSCVRRLEVFYPNSHRIGVYSTQSEYEVELNIRLG